MISATAYSQVQPAIEAQATMPIIVAPVAMAITPISNSRPTAMMSARPR